MKYKVPKTVLEVRAVKRKLSREIERLGWEGFHKKTAEETKEFMERVEKARLAKLAAKR